VIYFIVQSDEYVKIGYTSSRLTIERRLADLQVGNPYELTVCAIEDGDISHELYLHRMFKHDRVRGEWFRLNPNIQKYIDQLLHEPKPLDINEIHRIMQAMVDRVNLW